MLSLTVACHRSPTAPSLASAAAAAPATATALPIATPVSPSDRAHISIQSLPLTFVTRNSTTAPGSRVVDTLEIATDADFSSTSVLTFVPDATGLTSTESTLTLTPHTYFWRIRASVGDVIGPESSTFSFVVDPSPLPSVLLPPIPVEPVPDSVQSSQPVFLITDPVYPAGISRVTYRLQIARDAGFASALQQLDVPDSPFFGSGGSTRIDLGCAFGICVGSSLAPGDVYWRVKSIAASGGMESAYMPTQHFEVGPMFIERPTLIAPVHGAHAPSYHPILTVNMGRHSGRIYDVVLHVDVSTSPSFAVLAAGLSNSVPTVGTTYFTLSSTLSPGLYYWRAHATLSGQSAGTIVTDFTPTETFTVGPLTIQAPALLQPLPRHLPRAVRHWS